MKCGEISGHMTKQGKPCGQNVAADATQGCLWHSRGPRARSLMASKGPAARRQKRLIPVGSYHPQFETRDAVVRFAEDLAKKVLTSRVDPRRVDSALRAATVALSAFAAQTQEKLVDTLLRIEHGEAAMALLLRLQEGLAKGPRRPVPGRVVTIPEAKPS